MTVIPFPARKSALDAALEAFEKAGRRCRPGGPYLTKKSVRQLFRDGLTNPLLWMNYQGLAERHPNMDIDHAILFVELLFRKHLRERQVAIELWGRYSGANTRLILLKEVRLALRWIRRHAPQRYPEIRGAILYPELVQAAE